MALTPDELIVLAPELEKLAKLIGESLKKDENGKVTVTKEEGKTIAKAIAKIAVRFTKEAID